ncbi:MAG: site-specific integrase [Chloroflexi bacterium OHK40]
MDDFAWKRFPIIASDSYARPWVLIQRNLQLAPNTVLAYARALEDYLTFCQRTATPPHTATREQLAIYVRDLTGRPNPRRPAAEPAAPGLANATIQQYLTVLRLFFDYLLECGVIERNPVGRGHFTPGRAFGGSRDRSLLPRYHSLPWIPSDDQWTALLAVVRQLSLRNRTMFAFGYTAGLRREELCSLTVDDINPGQRLIRIRAETTKNHQARVVPYAEAASPLFRAYLAERRHLSSARGGLFLSESRRNRAQPVSIWTWSKVIADVATSADLPNFSTHTLRHLCLTDLARAGWELHEIALFAGHRSLETTRRYIHLSGRELHAKLASGMASIHAWRTQRLVATLTEGDADEPRA